MWWWWWFWTLGAYAILVDARDPRGLRVSEYSLFDVERFVANCVLQIEINFIKLIAYAIGSCDVTLHNA